MKMRLYQAFFNPSHPCRGGTTKSILENLISVPLPFFFLPLLISSNIASTVILALVSTIGTPAPG
ncbi:hypothetical protein FNL09_03310 [Staphylococcus saprophyticus]|nr:hypothetical protein FNL09_03310 [Staphylococcus saprophyticus]